MAEVAHVSCFVTRQPTATVPIVSMQAVIECMDSLNGAKLESTYPHKQCGTTNLFSGDAAER